MGNRNHNFVLRPFEEKGRHFISLVILAKSADVDRTFTLTKADAAELQMQLKDALTEVYRWSR